MAKEDILTFLDQQIDQKMTDYDVALDWNTKNHTIEIIFRLYLASNEELAGEEDIEAIEFEDGILLYTEKSQFDANDYLYTMPFDRKKGIESTTLAGLVMYLNEVLDQGMSDIFDFLEDEDARQKDRSDYSDILKKINLLVSERNRILSGNTKLDEESRDLAMRFGVVLSVLTMLSSFVLSLLYWAFK